MTDHQYPIVDNVGLVDPTAVQTYIDLLFQYVDWGDRVISLRGIGEKHTPKEGLFREPVWITPAWQAPANTIAKHAARWAQWHAACFMVPAVMRPDAAMHSDAGEEHVAEFTTILVDLDSGDTDGKLRWVETHIGPATMVVYSGGTTDSGHPKLHVYFALTEPTAETARVGRLRHVLAGKCGGDPAFQRITQIIRVPGTVHAKGGIARTVSIAQHDRKREYDLEDLAERIEELPQMPGVEPLKASHAVTAPLFMQGGGMNFAPVAAASAAVAHVMTNDIAEGGTEDRNRWSSFNQVVGHYLHQVRQGNVSLEEAAEFARGWMQAHMSPPWPEQRFQTEFTGLMNHDVERHGPMPQFAPPGAPVVYDRQTGEIIERPAANRMITSTDELLAWQVRPEDAAAGPLRRRYLIDGLILAGKRHLLVAEGGAGKTYLCMDMALRLAAADGQEPRLDWLGQEIRPEATGGTVILITAEDDADELAIRWNDIDPTGEMRQRAAGRLIAIPMDNIGGAFAFVSQDPRSREMLPSAQWARLMSAISGIRDRGGWVSAVIVDTLNATLHGEENSAAVIQEYVRAIAPICGELGAAFVVTHHIRKQGKEPIRDLDDMKEAIRGSTALPAAVRMVLGFWHATDYARRMRGMALEPRRGMVYRMGVVKANNNEAMQMVKTLLRDRSGLLVDVTMTDVLRNGPGREHEAWLALAVQQAAVGRAAFSKTNANGLYARRAQLPPILQSLGDKEMRHMVDKLLAEKKLVAARLANQKGGHPGYLDVPEGPVAKGQGYNDAGAWKHDWSQYDYDPSLDMVIAA